MEHLVFPSIAERCIDGSRGLQPTDRAVHVRRRAATLDLNLPSRPAHRFNRRSATRLHGLANRGLKVHGYPQPVAPRPPDLNDDTRYSPTPGNTSRQGSSVNRHMVNSISDSRIFSMEHMDSPGTAERCINGSRGLQPTDHAVHIRRRAATLDSDLPGRPARLFNRRSATRPRGLTNRGLKVHGYPQPVAPRPLSSPATVFCIFYNMRRGVNAPVKINYARPHPGPLPRGEGVRYHVAGLFSGLCYSH